ncbi:MAG: DUF1932 domain-containing protein [Hyphomicrobiaceae bacterium]|nr:DUF1932 domain-containing protein [Hyphomicrobiaceae bacterium]
MRIAFIGFGEVGQRFSKDLLARPHLRIAAFDIKFDPARPSPNEKAADALGVRAAPSAAAAADGADFVFSAVTADVAEAVAMEAAGYLAKGQLFLDLNSASPNTKRRAAGAVEGSGARYVECAVMAPVAAPGIAVPILAGGTAAEGAALQLNALGMNITAVATEVGKASAMKLCRSIMIKGIEALIGDCARSARRWGVEREVYGSLAQTFPGTDWAALAETMAGRVRQHGVRRAAEMREAAQMVAELGVDESLCLAVADAQLRGAAKGSGTDA